MSLHWGKLVENGRAKAVGVPWNEEELHARIVLKIPAEYVRDGILTLEAYKRAMKSDDKPIFRMTKPELTAMADNLEVEYSASTPRSELLSLVARAREKSNIGNSVTPQSADIPTAGQEE